MECSYNREDFDRFFETSTISELNRYLDSGWVHYGFSRRTIDEDCITYIIVAWPSGKGKPVIPPDPNIRYD